MDCCCARPRAVSTAVATRSLRPTVRESILAVALILGLAVLTGLAVGDPSPRWFFPLAAIAGLGVLYAGSRWPYPSLMLILGSSILLVVVRVSDLRSVNMIDVLLPTVLVFSYFGRARFEARTHEEHGPSHARLHAAELGFTRAVLVFYCLAALSLIQLARLAGLPAALDSALLLARAVQGLLLFPLCKWWLRTPERIQDAWRAMVVAGVVLALVNIAGVALWDVKRAGMTLFLNDTEGPISDPNEAGTAALVVGVILLIRHAMRPSWINPALGVLMLALLGLTQSRSAILAWAAFGLFTLHWVRPSRLLTGALGVAAMLPLLPHSFWIRMVRSIAIERGTFEAFSFFQRVYGWRTAWGVVQDHPWTGVGYLGFRFVSHRYNELRVVFGTVENYFYEVLVSMGIPGLVLLAIVIVKLFNLGHTVGRIAPPGTLAHHMARFHAPLCLGLLVANLTGDNFMGMLAIAQLSIWTAVLVCSGHAAVAVESDACR